MDNFELHLGLIKDELARGMGALLTSNPRNPTGNCLSRDQLRELHRMCRENVYLSWMNFILIIIMMKGVLVLQSVLLNTLRMSIMIRF